MQMWAQTNAMGRATWESLIELSQITARSIERVTQHGILIMGDCAATAIHRLQGLIAVKDAREVLLSETRLATECGEKWMANAHRVVEISLQAQKELGQWMSDALRCWHGQDEKAADQGQQTWPRIARPSRPDSSSLRRKKGMVTVDDPMLALIVRFVCGGGQLQLPEGEFILDQIAAIQRYVAQFPAEQRNTRALEWIEEHAEHYRQAWQKKAVYARATQTRCPDCPLTDEGLASHCEIHHRWLDLLNHYIAGEVSSRRYVEDTLRLLTDYKARLKVSALKGACGTG